MPKFLVREREFTQLSRPLAWSGKRVAQFTPWKTIGRHPSFEAAREQRAARNTGLFERVVLYRGAVLVDASGEQVVCGPTAHARRCTCG